MKFSVQYESGSVKWISVTGEIQSGSETQHFLKLTYEVYNQDISITFLDVNMLPCQIVERLWGLQRKIKCKIYVLKRYLYSYLINLGIKCEYIIKKSSGISEPNAEPASDLDRGQVIQFLEDINSQYGYDYTEYQIESIMRRIKISMLRENVNSLNKFKAMVLNDQDIFEQLFLDFSINTTEFFRDHEVFNSIKNKVFPYLDSHSHIKIWCVGCSNGKEPYSLAILLHECGILEKTQIYATDINPYIIEEAKNGIFSTNNISMDIENYRKSGGYENLTDYFELNSDYMKIRKPIRNKILFFQHSLIGNGILNEFQLILCRNVFIYFNSSLQRKTLENFYYSLDDSGFLILGKSEGMLGNGGHNYFGKYDEEHRIYKRL